LKIPASAMNAGGGSQSLDLSTLPEPVAEAVRSSYGDSIGRLFLIAALVALASILAVVFMKPTRLRDHFNTEPSADAARAAPHPVVVEG
jgi:hypothetical protein